MPFPCFCNKKKSIDFKWINCNVNYTTINLFVPFNWSSMMKKGRSWWLNEKGHHSALWSVLDFKIGRRCRTSVKLNLLLSLSSISPFDFLLPAIPHFETNGLIPAPLRASVTYWVGEENCQGGKKPTKWIPLQRWTLAEAVEVKKCCVYLETPEFCI